MRREKGEHGSGDGNEEYNKEMKGLLEKEEEGRRQRRKKGREEDE